MFDLSNAFRRAKALAGRFLRSLAGKRPSMVARMTASASDVAASNCFQKVDLGRVPAGDCLEFFAPDGRLIWEPRADDDA
jgi:hypothetical protein